MRRCTRVGLTLSLLFHAMLGWWLLRASVELPGPAPTPVVIDLAAIRVPRPAPAPDPEPPKPEQSAVESIPEPEPEPEPAPAPEPAPEPEPEPEPVVQAIPKPAPRVVKTRKRVHPPRHRQPRRKEPRQHPVAVPSPTSSPRKAPLAVASAAAPPALSAETVATIRERYKAALMAALRKHKFYPRRALRRGREGTVKIGFDILADGRIVNIHLVHSAGARSLDKAALQVPKALGHFDPLPKALGRQRWSLIVPLAYRLH